MYTRRFTMELTENQLEEELEDDLSLLKMYTDLDIRSFLMNAEKETQSKDGWGVEPEEVERQRDAVAKFAGDQERRLRLFAQHVVEREEQVLFIRRRDIALQPEIRAVFDAAYVYARAYMDRVQDESRAGLRTGPNGELGREAFVVREVRAYGGEKGAQAFVEDLALTRALGIAEFHIKMLRAMFGEVTVVVVVRQAGGLALRVETPDGAHTMPLLPLTEAKRLGVPLPITGLEHVETLLPKEETN